MTAPGAQCLDVRQFIALAVPDVQHLDMLMINGEQYPVLLVERPAKHAGGKVIVLRRDRESLWHVEQRLQKRIKPVKPPQSSYRELCAAM